MMGGNTQYPLAGLPIKLVLGASSLFRASEDVGHKSFVNPRVVMTSDGAGALARLIS